MSDNVQLIFSLIFATIGAMFFITLTMSTIESKRHYEPEFTLVSFTLKGLNVSASSQHVGGNWEACFQIKSRHLMLEYQDLESSVSYNGQVLSHTHILAFNQRLTLIQVYYSTLDALASQQEAIVSPASVTGITADLARDSVGFDVRVVGKVSTSKQLQVLCGVVPITISEDGVSGSFIGGPHKCEVKVDDLPTRYRL